MRPTDTEQDPPVRLVTVRGAARLMACSPEFINDLLRLGVLRRVKLGRATRVRIDDIDQYIADATEVDRNNLGCSETVGAVA